MHCFKSCNYEAVLLNKTIIISIQIFSKPTTIKEIKMFFFFLPCPVPSDWISAHPAMICIHHTYHSRSFSAGRDVANQKQSVTNFLMGANCHSSVVLGGQFKCSQIFWHCVHESNCVWQDRLLSTLFSLSPLFFSSKETRDEVYLMSDANGWSSVFQLSFCLSYTWHSTFYCSHFDPVCLFLASDSVNFWQNQKWVGSSVFAQLAAVQERPHTMAHLLQSWALCQRYIRESGQRWAMAWRKNHGRVRRFCFETESPAVSQTGCH